MTSETQVSNFIMYVYDKNKLSNRKSVMFETKSTFLFGYWEYFSTEQTFWKAESCTALIWPHDGALDSIDSHFPPPLPVPLLA